ncbi:MAG: RHS repeat-associated core domain-containing protein [Cyclobacteriaceae bacterium]
MKRFNSSFSKYKNHFYILMFILMSTQVSHAQEVIPDDLKLNRSNPIRQSAPFSSTHLVSDMELNDDERVFQNCMEGNYYFVSKLNHRRVGATIDKSWSLDINFTISLNGTELWTSDLSIDPQAHKPTATSFLSSAISCEEEYEFRVNSLTWANEPSVDVKSDIELVFMLYREQEYESIELGQPPVGPTVVTDHQAGIFEITIPDDVPNAIGYELEWVFANSDYFNELELGWESGIFDIKEPVSVQLSVDDPTFKIYAFYGLGNVIFRYRAIGYNPDNPEYLVKGAYSHITNVMASDFDPAPDALAPESFDQESPVFHNWQKVTTYAEGGKSKTVVSIMDGTLRNRQTITNLNSHGTEGLRIIAENQYDYEGRPVVNTLPAPTALKSRFYPDFNKFSGDLGKHAYDNGRTQANSPMDETLGAARYYSANNTIDIDADHDALSDYIPKSDGQPYAQTAYTNDNSGRPSRQGGVGPTFSVDGSRATRYFYAGAVKEELERLFGSDVGNAAHYKKNMVVDPNKQASVSYLDQEGRVIATALAGQGAGNLQKLPSNEQAQGLITMNLSDQNAQTSDEEKELIFEFLNVEPEGSYKFKYKLDLLSDEIDVTGSEIYDPFPCSECFYDLKFSLSGTEGESIPLTIDTEESTSDIVVMEGNDILIKNFSVSGCAAETVDVVFNAELEEQGSYKITKTLNLSVVDYEEVKAIIENDTETEAVINTIRSTFQVDNTECKVLSDLSLLDDDSWREFEDVLYDVTAVGCSNFTSECAIAYCNKNQESEIFEIKTSTVQTWPEAVAKKLDNIVNQDPYFREGLSGYGGGYKDAFISALNNIEVRFTKTGECAGLKIHSGTIWEITDPTNTKFFINECGDKDPNGFHILYLETLDPNYSPNPPIPDGQEYVNVKRWNLFRAFYFRERQKIEHLVVSETLSGCTELLTSLAPIEDGFNVTADETSITNWADSQEWSGLFEDGVIDVDHSSVANALFDYCGVTKSTSEINTIIGYLDAENRSGIVASFPGCDISSYLDFVFGWGADPNSSCIEVAIDYPCPSFQSKLLIANGFLPCLCDDPCDFSCHNIPQPIAPPNGDPVGSSANNSSSTAESCCTVTVWLAENCADGRPPGELSGPVITCQNLVPYEVPCGEEGDLYEIFHQNDPEVWLQSGSNFSIEPHYNVTHAYGSTLDDFFTLTYDFPTFVGFQFTGATTCLQYTFDYPDFAYEFDFKAYEEQCEAIQTEQNEDLIALAIEDYYQEQVSLYMTAYKQVCIDQNEQISAEYETGEYHHTLYYYDQAGNLVQTVPPMGVDLDDQDHSFKTRYKYNSLNQLIWQQTPDAGVTLFYYDSKSQLRLSRNAQQALDEDYSYTRYDALGRIVEVGEIRDGAAITAAVAGGTLRDLTDDPLFPAEDDYELADITRTYYDTGADLSGLTLSEAFDQENLRNRVSYTTVQEGEVATGISATYYSYDIHGNVKSILQDVPGLDPKRIDYLYDLVSGNVNYVLYQYDTEEQFIHRYDYDEDNRINDVFTSVDGFTWEREAKYLYYPHGPLARTVIGEDRIQGIDYAYTLQGWLKGINSPGLGDPMSDGAVNNYVAKDEFSLALGYFAGDYEAVGGAPENGSRDGIWNRYKNVIMGINESSGDFENIDAGLYNGNITWMNKHIPEVGRQQEEDEDAGLEAVLYDYDQLNRIMSSRALSQYSGGTFESRSADLQALDTDYGYDANGNLDFLKRRGVHNENAADYNHGYLPGTNKMLALNADFVETATSADIASDANITYPKVMLDANPGSGSNETLTVTASSEITLEPGFEFVASNGTEFSGQLVDPDQGEVASGGLESAGYFRYDNIGNLIEQKNLDGIVVSTIDWTVYGKVRSVDAEGNTASYLYDAAGNRVSKSVTGAGGDLSTYYIRDASGNTMATYIKDGAEPVKLSGMSIYGSSRLGRYIGGVGTGERVLGTRYYELSNHLGNVMAVVSDDISREGGHTRADVVSTSDYYPFGLGYHEYYNDRPDRNEAEANRYGFNGKERDKSMGTSLVYDYGFRIYNPQIGKFLSVDPLTSDYASWSPYPFAMNRPIDGVDLDGLEFISWFNLWHFNLWKEGSKAITESSIDGMTFVVTSVPRALTQGTTFAYGGLKYGNRSAGVKTQVDLPVYGFSWDSGFGETEPFGENPTPDQTIRMMTGVFDLVTLGISIENALVKSGGLTRVLANFENGASKLVSTAQLDDAARKFPNGTTFGNPVETFVSPTKEIDDLLKAGKSREEIANALGITDELFLEGDLVRIDIDPKGFDNLRKTTGAEVGANEKYIPGGETSGGVTEAILSNVKKDSEFVKASIVK